MVWIAFLVVHYSVVWTCHTGVSFVCTCALADHFVVTLPSLVGLVYYYLAAIITSSSHCENDCHYDGHIGVL